MSSAQAGQAPKLELFALLEAPVGVQAAMLTVLPYYILRAKGVSMEQVTALAAFCSLPAVFFFLYAPLTDFFMRRKFWLMAMAALSATLTAAAILISNHADLASLRVLLFASTTTNILINCAAGGLISNLLRDEQRARVGSWIQIGNLGVGSLAFTLFIFLTTHSSLKVLAAVSCAMTILPTLPALFLDEPALPPVGRSYRVVLRQIRTEMAKTFLRSDNVPGLLLLLSPIGTGTLANVLTGLSEQYHASAGELSFANGWGAGIATAVGAALVLLVPPRWDRRVVYAASGLVYASASFLLASGPDRPSTFVVGMLASNLAQGFCWSALTGLILSLLGTRGRSESSRYALLGSLAFAASTYMVWLDGRVIERFGFRSLGVFDGCANLAAVALFFLWWRFAPGRGIPA